MSGLDPIENNHQDINQDGYGDIVVGAPGVGTDSGAAYVVFGGASFTEASYTLGSIGSDGSYRLIGQSDEGYGGFSVSGAGEREKEKESSSLMMFCTASSVC